MYESDIRTNARSRFYVVKDFHTGAMGAYSGTWFIFEEAHLGTIATATEYRGQGLAEQLIAYTAMHAVREGLSYMILEVRRSNTPAQRLYEKLGFDLVGIRKAYYSDTGEDALLMTASNLGQLAARLYLPEEG